MVAPIGHHDAYNNNHFFKGIFDSQGHTISNLKITTNEEAAGIFGYTMHGLMIKNIVMFSSCTVTSLSENPIGVGAILGYCISGGVQCMTANSVNMGQVLFKGKAYSSTANVGGYLGTVARTLKTAPLQIQPTTGASLMRARAVRATSGGFWAYAICTQWQTTATS